MNNNLYIRKADSKDTPALLDILNNATLKLLKKGVMQWEYPWQSDCVLSFTEKEEFYIVFCNDNPCGCFGLRPFTDNYFVPQDKDGLYWYHLAVHPEYDKTGIGWQICSWVQEYSRNTGKAIYFDCWAGNKSLRNYYTFNGFEPLGEFPEEDYFVAAFRYKQ